MEKCMYQRIFLWVVLVAVLAGVVWFSFNGAESSAPPGLAAGITAAAPQDVLAEERAASAPLPAMELASLRTRVIGHPERWNMDMRRQLLALDPAQLLDLLDDDEMLVREDARHLAEEIFSVCAFGIALASLPEDQAGQVSRLALSLDSPGNTWCKRLLGDEHGSVAWDRLKTLLALAQHADPAHVPYYEQAEQRAIEAAARADGSLLSLLLEDDSVQVTAALAAMLDAGDNSVIPDWNSLEQLDSQQQNHIWHALWHGLDCQWTDNYSENSFVVASLCNRPSFQCDAGADYYAIVRRSLSPAQFEALTMLMNRINAWRHQHDG